MISQDVFHSFSIPDFRVKREVIPGRYSTVWFKRRRPARITSSARSIAARNHSA
jgi:cytochrome c oxidase subunit 2